MALALACFCSSGWAKQIEESPRPVLAYQVSNLRAVTVSGADGSPLLRISARALAPHPGYLKPRIVTSSQSSDKKSLHLRFLLDPPPDHTGLSWPMVLTEVEAIALIPKRQYKRVILRGKDQTLITRINPSNPIFPRQWGKPPFYQTKDWRPLPARYGYGSSTLANWIRQRLRAD